MRSFRIWSRLVTKIKDLHDTICFSLQIKFILSSYHIIQIYKTKIQVT